MPLPHPNKGQSQKEFISSCMANSVMNKEWPNQNQRAAVCYSQWKRKKHKKQIKGDVSNPKWDDKEFETDLFIIKPQK